MNRLWLIFIYLILSSAIFVYIRLPNVHAWFVEFQSDHAIVGLMAKHITEGHFPVFFYGQNYMGSLISLTSVTASSIMNLFGVRESIAGFELTVGPLAIAYATLFWAMLGIPVWFFAIRKKINVTTAWLFVPLLVFPSIHLFKPSTLTNGSIAIFTISGLLWFLTPNSTVWPNRSKFAFAAVLGLGWWTNQNIVFFAIPILAMAASDAGLFHSTMFRVFVTRRKYFYPVYFICGLLLLFGLFIALRGGPFEEHLFGKRIRIPSGTSTVRDAILIVIAFHLIRYFVLLAKLKPLRDETWQFVFSLRYAAGGFLLGYFPVWAGKLFGWYPKNYGLKTNIMPIEHWLPHTWKTLTQTLPGTLASGSTLLFLFALVFVARALWVHREQPWWREVKYLLYVLLSNLAVTLVSERALGVNFRYLFASYFAFWILFCLGCQQFRFRWQVQAPIALLIVLLTLFTQISPIIAAARTELVKGFTRKHTIANQLVNLREQGFTTCWGDFWTAYLVTYLSNEQIIVSPHPSARDNQIRLPNYHKKVERAAPNCYLYRKQPQATAELFFDVKNPWTKD